MSPTLPDDSLEFFRIPIADGAVGAVDEAISIHMERFDAASGTGVEFDLRPCRYLEVEAALCVSATLFWCRAKKVAVRLRLPESKATRDFLRQWSVPLAFEESTKMRFWDLVHPTDRTYFGENPELSDQKYSGRVVLYEGRQHSIPENYFPIHTYRPSGEHFSHTLATDEAIRWRPEFLTSILARHLRGPQNYLSSRIVWEALMNAIRHPRASLIQTGSRFYHSSHGLSHLTLACWDNGLDIVSTLRNGIAAGSIVPESSQTYPEVTYTLNVDGSVSTVTSRAVPGLESPDHFVLLASTFPGTTSNPAAATSRPPVLGDSPRFAGPGMGLYLLLNAAVTVFGGAVSVRSSRFFMNIKGPRASSSGANYSAKIVTRTARYCFPGNLLVIRLPLRRRKP